MDQQAPVAQLVEQRTENPRVAGSIPALGIRRKHREIGVFLVFTGFIAIILLKTAYLDMTEKEQISRPKWTFLKRNVQ